MIDFGKMRLRRFDSLNWCIERQQDKGKWLVLGYFPKLEQAANYLLTMSIGDADSIQQLIDSIETARSDIIAAVKVACGETGRVCQKTGSSASKEKWRDERTYKKRTGLNQHQ